MHSSFLQLGHLHIPLYGLCAAVGVMAALALSQITARLTRLNPAAVWDAALFMVFAALVISRALLVLGDWHSFLTAPLLILALPSLNDTGVLLTAICTFVYLRRKKLPLLGFLDALAPCLALLWAFLSLGDLIAGNRDGMPTTSPLSMSDGMMSIRVQPVELYTLLAALILCGILLRWLVRHAASQRGHASALGLILAGAILFLLDFLRLPSDLFEALALDPVQWLGLAMVIVGTALFIATPTVSEIPHAV